MKNTARKTFTVLAILATLGLGTAAAVIDAEPAAACCRLR